MNPTRLLELQRDLAALQRDVAKHQLDFARTQAQRFQLQAQAANHSTQDSPVLPSEDRAYRPVGNNPSQISGDADLKQSIFEKCLKQSQQTSSNLESLLEINGYANI